MDDATDGQWRILSKLGAGYSTSRSVGEIISAGYGCVPLEGFNWEFTLAARASVALDIDLVHAERRLVAAVEATLVAMATGKLD